MTALPPDLPRRLQADVHVNGRSAYNQCLLVERHLRQAVKDGKDIGHSIIYIRILGYLLHFVPTDVGLVAVVNEIISAQSEEALLDVGKTYFDHFIRAFRANRSHIPTPTNHSSRGSFDETADMLNDTLEEAPQSYTTTKKHALHRDGYRCVITGTYDRNSVMKCEELTEKLNADRNLTAEGTQCAHIFSSTNQAIEPGPPKCDVAATMWAVMERLGYTQLPDDLNGPNVHRLDNVMTVIPAFHSAFDELKVWLVATTVENEYKLEAVKSFIINAFPKYVTFSTPDPVKFPVPSAVYLAIHAACAKVAHLSGAGALIDKYYRDIDDSKTLDPNGASAEVLEHAIFQLHASGHPQFE